MVKPFRTVATTIGVAVVLAVVVIIILRYLGIPVARGARVGASGLIGIHWGQTYDRIAAEFRNGVAIKESSPPVEQKRDLRGVATVVLNRPNSIRTFRDGERFPSDDAVDEYFSKLMSLSSRSSGLFQDEAYFFFMDGRLAGVARQCDSRCGLAAGVIYTLTFGIPAGFKWRNELGPWKSVGREWNVGDTRILLFRQWWRKDPVDFLVVTPRADKLAEMTSSP